jgi:hypothetical protein
MRLTRFKFCSRRVPGPWCLLSAGMILSASLAFHAPARHEATTRGPSPRTTSHRSEARCTSRRYAAPSSLTLSDASSRLFEGGARVDDVQHRLAAAENEKRVVSVAHALGQSRHDRPRVDVPI